MDTIYAQFDPTHVCSARDTDILGYRPTASRTFCSHAIHSFHVLLEALVWWPWSRTLEVRPHEVDPFTTRLCRTQASLHRKMISSPFDDLLFRILQHSQPLWEWLNKGSWKHDIGRLLRQRNYGRVFFMTNFYFLIWGVIFVYEIFYG
jgi:hypothetical protein